MTTSFTSNLTPVDSNGAIWARYGGIGTSDIFVFTFSDGSQIAITAYDDHESADLQIGTPGDDVINFYTWGLGNGGTFAIHHYAGGSLGALIHTYTLNTTPGDYVNGAFQLTYDPDSRTLDMLGDDNGDSPSRSTGAYSSFNGTSILSGAPVCFLAGTLILTDRGEIPVEALAAGDRVVTRFGGLRPIRWIGTQHFEGRLAGPNHQPIRIRAGALDRGVPSCDLLVSPGHAILVDSALVHAAGLVNGVTITRERRRDRIAYYHLDLGPHDCVLANSAWAESYFEDQNRDSFHNAGDFHARFPGQAPQRQRTCLPVIAADTPRAAGYRAMLAPRMAA